MAEYIDKEKLLQKLSRMIEYCKNDNKVNGLTALFQVGDAIMDCPTDDVVEVVRCKDCLYWEKGKDFEPYCNHFCNVMTDTNADDYCSYGARKKGEGE